jgi:hypothetical protein
MLPPVLHYYKIHKRKICSRAQQLLFIIITKGDNVSALVSHHQACINPNHKDSRSAEDGILLYGKD